MILEVNYTKDLKKIADMYGEHSVPKPLIHLANKINQFSVFNKRTWLLI